MPLYRMTYKVKTPEGEIEGDITLKADSFEQAMSKAQKSLAPHYEVEKDDVKITTIVDVEKAAVSATR